MEQARRSGSGFPVPVPRIWPGRGERTLRREWSIGSAVYRIRSLAVRLRARREGTRRRIGSERTACEGWKQKGKGRRRRAERLKKSVANAKGKALARGGGRGGGLILSAGLGTEGTIPWITPESQPTDVCSSPSKILLLCCSSCSHWIVNKTVASPCYAPPFRPISQNPRSNCGN